MGTPVQLPADGPGLRKLLSEVHCELEVTFAEVRARLEACPHIDAAERDALLAAGLEERERRRVVFMRLLQTPGDEALPGIRAVLSTIQTSEHTRDVLRMDSPSQQKLRHLLFA